MNSRTLLDKLKSAENDKEEMKLLTITVRLDALNELWLDGSDDYEKKDAKFIADLQKLSDSMVFKLAESSEAFRNYCDRHTGLWREYLVARGYHGDTLRALDTTQKCTPLKQYLGQFLLAQWNNSTSKKNDLAVLDKACEMNIFPALAARCDFNLAILAANINTMEPHQIKEYEDKILSDTAQINNQYWAPGYIFSFSVFMQLAQLHHVDVQSEDDLSAAQAENHFYTYALECEMMAKKLYNEPTSQQIMKEHGIDEWKKDEKFLNPEKAEELVLKSLHIERNHPIYKKVTEEVEQKLSQFRLA